MPSTVAVSDATPVIVPPRRSRSKKGIAPLSVPPVRTTRLVPASTVPLVYVQLRPVRMVPTRSSVPEGLSMTRLGRAPAPGTAVAEPVNVWSSVPSMRMVPVPAPALAAWLIGPRAAMVPRFTTEPDIVSRPVTMTASPAAMVFVPAANVTLP